MPVSCYQPITLYDILMFSTGKLSFPKLLRYEMQILLCVSQQKYMHIDVKASTKPKQQPNRLKASHLHLYLICYAAFLELYVFSQLHYRLCPLRPYNEHIANPWCYSGRLCWFISGDYEIVFWVCFVNTVCGMHQLDRISHKNWPITSL